MFSGPIRLARPTRKHYWDPLLPFVLLTRLGFVTLLTGHILPAVHTIRVVGTAIAIKNARSIRHTAFVVVESKLLQKVVGDVKALAIFNEKALRHCEIFHTNPQSSFKPESPTRPVVFCAFTPRERACPNAQIRSPLVRAHHHREKRGQLQAFEARLSAFSDKQRLPANDGFDYEFPQKLRF